MSNIVKNFKNMKKGNKAPVSEEQKFNIGFLVFWVGTKCSLRCRDCGNLIPYASQSSYDMDEIIRDLKNILNFCNVKKMQIQGGEPFTHKEIGKLIGVIDELNIEEVIITTNGTMRLSEDVMSQMRNVKNSKFQIVISSYECAEDKQNEFYNALVGNNINCMYYKFANGDGTWLDQGGINTCRNNDDKEVQELYTSCEFKVCLSLVDGQLFRCGRAKVSEEIFDLKYHENDYLDIRNLTDAGQGLVEITKFINNPVFKEYCRYCLGTKEVIPAGIQIHTNSK